MALTVIYEVITGFRLAKTKSYENAMILRSTLKQSRSKTNKQLIADLKSFIFFFLMFGYIIKKNYD